MGALNSFFTPGLHRLFLLKIVIHISSFDENDNLENTRVKIRSKSCRSAMTKIHTIKIRLEIRIYSFYKEFYF